MKWPKETGCFVYRAILRTKSLYKSLTPVLLFVAFFSSSILALPSILLEEKFNTHLRWNLHVDKKQVLITKTGSGFYIETFQLPLFKRIRTALNSINMGNGYFSRVVFNTDGFPRRPARIKVILKDSQVELFSFYRSQDRKYILDFWNSGDDEIQNRNPAGLGSGLKQKVAKSRVVVTEKRPLGSERVLAKKSSAPRSRAQAKRIIQEYRDFRYGAALIWDYPSLPPQIEEKINVERKTPDYFYPIKDRDLESDDDREAHLQLSINLYRRGKHGLMAKSINLYGKKYGVDKNYELNEFLKALALIKENLNHPQSSPFKAGLAILSNITDRTKDYRLKKAIYLYQIQYLMKKKNMIDTLKMGKRLYGESKINSDQETVKYAAETIFYTLSELGQVEKIKKFSSEKDIQKVVPPQTLLAYNIFSHHKENKMEKVINLFQQKKSQMQRPMAASILYNVAEAYFRRSLYKKAIKVYYDFLKNYGHMRESSFVRVRLALSHDLLSGNLEKAIKLYEQAINLSSHSRARYEAKLRYVAMRNTRKIRPNNNDRKVLSFLEYSPDEKSVINKDLKTLLWLVRLRVFINSGDYRKALSYITALPIKTLKPVVKRMFEGDGAEIVYGMIVNSFERGDTSRVIKLWEIYQDVYEDKVAGRPYLNFVVAQSYITLGLRDSSERIISNLKRIKKSPVRKFPLWVNRIEYGTVENLLAEINVLKIFREKNWQAIIKGVDRLDIAKERKLFYQTVALYHLKNFNQVIKVGEDFLRNTPDILPLGKTETYQFFEAYLESLYNNANLEKFKKAAGAVLDDLDRSRVSHAGLNSLAEKMRYLLIELLASSDKKKNRLQVEGHATKFFKDYQKSMYLGRIRFLLASNLINHQKKFEGLRILNELVASEHTSEYIKEMSKSEIANFKLSEKIIN